MTRVRLRWHPFVAGGVLKVGACTQKPGILSSRPTAGGVMVHDCDYGNWNYKSFLMKLGFHFRYVIFLQAPANGTRLNIGCFHSSHRIGEGSRCGSMKRS